MKEQSRVILPGEGLGKLKFGMSREDVRVLAGEPDEIEKYEHSDFDDKRAEAWHYDDPEISLAFEEFNNWKLTSIAISSPEYVLEEHKLHGMSYEDVLKLLKSLNIGDVDEDEIKDDDDEAIQLITVEDAGLHLWFEDGYVSEIQFSQIWEEEEE